MSIPHPSYTEYLCLDLEVQLYGKSWWYTYCVSDVMAGRGGVAREEMNVVILLLNWGEIIVDLFQFFFTFHHIISN